MTDLNLLVTLNVLLAEQSVTAAARRLGLSSSAMSRSLTRLRAVTGDPLLVRAGRRLVPTPHATRIRDEVATLVESANAILRPTEKLDLSRVSRRYVLRCSEGFVETIGPALLARIAREAPGITLQFLTKLDKDSEPLRQGSVDLETGVVDKSTAPEMMVLPLFKDRWIAVVRKGHQLANKRLTRQAFADCSHVLIERRGLQTDEINEALRIEKLNRRVGAIVNGFASALALARESDLVAIVPARHAEGLRKGMHALELPFKLKAFQVCLLWHPRMNGDLAHQWLRNCVKLACIS